MIKRKNKTQKRKKLRIKRNIRRKVKRKISKISFKKIKSPKINKHLRQLKKLNLLLKGKKNIKNKF